MALDGVYVTIWEFLAKPEFREEFGNFYGPDGEWVQLFRRSKAFLRTEFFRESPSRESLCHHRLLLFPSPSPRFFCKCSFHTPLSLGKWKC